MLRKEDLAVIRKTKSVEMMRYLRANDPLILKKLVKLNKVAFRVAMNRLISKGHTIEG